MKSLITLLVLFIFSFNLNAQVPGITYITTQGSELFVSLDDQGNLLYEAPQDYPAQEIKGQVSYDDKGVTVKQADTIYRLVFSLDCREIIQTIVYEQGQIKTYWNKD